LALHKVSIFSLKLIRDPLKRLLQKRARRGNTDALEGKPPVAKEMTIF